MFIWCVEIQLDSGTDLLGKAEERLEGWGEMSLITFWEVGTGRVGKGRDHFLLPPHVCCLVTCFIRTFCLKESG